MRSVTAEENANADPTLNGADDPPDLILGNEVTTTASREVPQNDQLAEVSFISGVDPSGIPNMTNFANYNANTSPPTYNTTQSLAHKWGGGVAGTPGQVTYAFDPASNWSEISKAGFVSAMSLWSAEANITFTQATTPSQAQMTIVRNTQGAANAAVSYRLPASGSTSLATIDSASFQIDPNEFGAIYDFDGPRDGFGIGTAIHELGHAIGLGHAGPYYTDAAARTQQLTPFDNAMWSMESYNFPNNRGTNAAARYYNQYTPTGTDWGNSGGPFTPMPLDILAAQRLYGAPISGPLSGGQTFGFNTNITGPIKQFFDFNIDRQPVITLWDSGSNNTLDLSGYSAPETVNLNAGTFSSVGGLTNNLAIAFNTQIDSAVGGSGGDTFITNENNNRIDGGGGTNTAVFQGNRADYEIANNAGTVNVIASKQGLGGNDSLSNMQFLQFADMRIDTSTLPVSQTVGPEVMSVASRATPDFAVDFPQATGSTLPPATPTNNFGIAMLDLQTAYMTPSLSLTS